MLFCNDKAFFCTLCMQDLGDIIIRIYSYLFVFDLEPSGTEGLIDICAVQGEV